MKKFKQNQYHKSNNNNAIHTQTKTNTAMTTINSRALTTFSRRVLSLCKLIPRSNVCTYKQLATALGDKNYVRAVGNALRHNPYAPLVPCHRVISSDRTLGGYSGQTDINHKNIKQKINMLANEGVIIEYNNNVYTVAKQSIISQDKLNDLASTLTDKYYTDESLNMFNELNDYIETTTTNTVSVINKNVNTIEKYAYKSNKQSDVVVVLDSVVLNV